MDVRDSYKAWLDAPKLEIGFSVPLDDLHVLDYQDLIRQVADDFRVQIDAVPIGVHTLGDLQALVSGIAPMIDEGFTP